MELTEGISLSLCNTTWLPKTIQHMCIWYHKFYIQFSAYVNNILLVVLFQSRAVFPPKICTHLNIQSQFLQIEGSVSRNFSFYLNFVRSLLLGSAGSTAKSMIAVNKINSILFFVFSSLPAKINHGYGEGYHENWHHYLPPFLTDGTYIGKYLT